MSIKIDFSSRNRIDVIASIRWKEVEQCRPLPVNEYLDKLKVFLTSFRDAGRVYSNEIKSNHFENIYRKNTRTVLRSTK